MKSWKAWVLLPLFTFIFGLAVGCSDDGGKRKKAKSPIDDPTVPGHGHGGHGKFDIYHLWGQTMSIVSDNAYRDFLEEFGVVCNPYSWVNWGTIDCKNWDDRAWLEVELYTDTLPTLGAAIVYAYPSGMFGFNSPAIPIYIEGEFKERSDGKFEMRRTGYAGTASFNAIIRVVVTGRIDDNQVLAEIHYRDKLMGRATLFRID